LIRFDPARAFVFNALDYTHWVVFSEDWSLLFRISGSSLVTVLPFKMYMNGAKIAMNCLGRIIYHSFLISLLAPFIACLYFSDSIHAQVPTNITSDNSLGTQVTPNGNVYDITGGTRPDNGTNLFHSFGQFSVGGGDTANFLNDTGADTTNILGRVTGGDPSSIFGTIQTTDFPGANLFLLNPAGVIFGPSASLNVSGSFYASTADFVRLGEDGIFYAELGEESVLTIAAPTAFGFLSDNPQGITLDQSQLIVEADQTLGLVGGDVDISGAQFTAPNGNIVLASVASPGEVTGIGGTDIQVTAHDGGFADNGECHGRE
jgi:filamentous hemagglutinin family protein